MPIMIAPIHVWSLPPVHESMPAAVEISGVTLHRAVRSWLEVQPTCWWVDLESAIADVCAGRTFSGLVPTLLR